MNYENLDFAVFEITFTNTMDLHSQIHQKLESRDSEDTRIYTIKHISFSKNDPNKAFVIIAQDLSKVVVEFQCNTSVFRIMSYEEINFLKETGYVLINDRSYRIDSIMYSLDTPEYSDFASSKVVIKITENS